MRCGKISKTALAALALALFQGVQAHTWIELLNRIAPNGTMVGDDGFPLGMFGRDQGGNPDAEMTYLLPPNDNRNNGITDTDLMKKASQKLGSNSAKFPALKAAPGDFIALRYQENGHVTLPATQAGKPANRGTVFIYGTASPADDDTFLSIHKVWNAAGTGGDKRGKLLATRNYDDGQCYQINGGDISTQRQEQFPKPAEAPQGANLWCQSDVLLPTDLPVGKPYSLYWVWDWPTTNPDGTIRPEVYTTAITIDVVSTCSGGAKGDDCVPDLGATSSSGPTVGSKAFANTFAKGQNLNNAAVLAQLNNLFQVDVDGLTTGATNGAAAGAGGTVSSIAVSSAAAAAATSPAASSSKGDANAPAVPAPTAIAGADGKVTVTVTAAPVTVTSFRTVTIGGGGSAKPSGHGSGGRKGSNGSGGGGSGGRYSKSHGGAEGMTIETAPNSPATAAAPAPAAPTGNAGNAGAVIVTPFMTKSNAAPTNAARAVRRRRALRKM